MNFIIRIINKRYKKRWAICNHQEKAQHIMACNKDKKTLINKNILNKLISQNQTYNFNLIVHNIKQDKMNIINIIFNSHYCPLLRLLTLSIRNIFNNYPLNILHHPPFKQAPINNTIINSNTRRMDNTLLALNPLKCYRELSHWALSFIMIINSNNIFLRNPSYNLFNQTTDNRIIYNKVNKNKEEMNR